MIAVLAGNYQQYENFLRYWIRPMMIDKFIYIFGEHQVFGRHFDDLLLIGTWYERTDKDRIIDGIKSSVKRRKKCSYSH